MLELRRGPRGEDRRSLPSAPAPLLESDLYLAGGVRPPAFRPRKDRPPWRLSIPLDWAADPFTDENWRFHLHAWRMMDPLIRLWFRDRDPALLREMFAYPRDWLRFHRAGGSCPVSWNDMLSGVRAFKLAFLLERRRTGDLVLDAGDDADLLELVDSHAGFLSRRRNVPRSNHGLIQAVGYRQLGRQAPDRRSCRGSEGRSARHLRRVLASQFSREAIQREHSPGYHFFVTDVLRGLRVAELFADVSGVADLLERASLNRAWLCFPDGEVSRIGDGGRTCRPGHPAGCTRVVAGRRFAIGDFSRSGYAIVRSVAPEPAGLRSMLFMTAMYNGRVHKHADDLSFELFELGQRVLIDSGAYDFQWDAMRRYVYSAAAHNTVDLADRPLVPSSTVPYGSGLRRIRIDGDCFILGGRVRRARWFDHRRTLRYRPGVSLEIDDKLDSDRHCQYVGRLHFRSTLTVSAEGGVYAVRDGERAIATVEPPAGAELNLVRGQTRPLLGWETIARREMAPACVLEAHMPGRRQRMQWRVSFAACDPADACQ